METLAAPAEQMEASPQSPLTIARATLLFLPIAASWVLLMAEQLIIFGAVERRPNPGLTAAALLPLMALCQCFEAPVADLITTSTTLTKHRRHSEEVRKFALLLVLGVAALQALLIFTPLYNLVVGKWLAVSGPTFDSIRTALLIMLPWPAMIGWRRFCQGLLMRRQQTQIVGAGTVVRIGIVSVSVVAISRLTQVPGVMLAALVMVIGVFSETAFVTVITLARWSSRLDDSDQSIVQPLGARKLVMFHAPLALASLVLILQNPLQAAALARMPDPIVSKGGFQGGSTLMWAVVAIAMGLPEFVIAQMRNNAPAVLLRRFCLMVGFTALAAVVLLYLTGLDRKALVGPLEVELDQLEPARLAFVAGAPFPILVAIGAYLRAKLIARHLTTPRLGATIISISALALTLWLGIRVQGNGVLWAQASVSVWLLADLLVLYWVGLRADRQIAS